MNLPKTPHRWTWLMAAAPVWWCLPLLGACDKAAEPAKPTMPAPAADAVIASQFEKDGKLVHGNTPQGATPASLTPATVSSQPGGLPQEVASVEATDVGLPFYPGAQVMVREGKRVDTPEQRTVVVVLETNERAELVAKFYRDKLRALAGSKRMVENSNGKDVMFMLLAHEKNEPSLTVHIDSRNDRTRRIQLTSSVRFSIAPAR